MLADASLVLGVPNNMIVLLASHRKLEEDKDTSALVLDEAPYTYHLLDDRFISPSGRWETSDNCMHGEL